MKTHLTRQQPTCADCKYYMPHRHLATHGTCNHPDQPVSLETGEALVRCKDARSMDGPCGFSGALFVPRDGGSEGVNLYVRKRMSGKTLLVPCDGGAVMAPAKSAMASSAGALVGAARPRAYVCTQLTVAEVRALLAALRGRPASEQIRQPWAVAAAAARDDADPYADADPYGEGTDCGGHL